MHSYTARINYPEQTTTEFESLDSGDNCCETSDNDKYACRQSLKKFTTDEGHQEFMAPVVNADFRVGGIIESSPKLIAKIRVEDNVEHVIIGYIPKQMLIYKILNVPQLFLHLELV